MDPFALPPKEKLAEIAARQDEKEQEIQAARQQQSPNEQADAAKLIQVGKTTNAVNASTDS